jgi:DNA-directed RNA polymerase specialized sigma24 family protein
VSSKFVARVNGEGRVGVAGNGCRFGRVVEFDDDVGPVVVGEFQKLAMAVEYRIKWLAHFGGSGCQGPPGFAIFPRPQKVCPARNNVAISNPVGRSRAHTCDATTFHNVEMTSKRVVHLSDKKNFGVKKFLPRPDKVERLTWSSHSNAYESQSRFPRRRRHSRRPAWLRIVASTRPACGDGSFAMRVGALVRTRFPDAFDPHDVVDAVDRTFEELWRRACDSRLANVTQLWPWLARSALRNAIDIYRRKRRWSTTAGTANEDRQDFSLEELGELSLIAQGLESPWAGLVQAEYLEAFAECVADLPPMQKLVGELMLEAAQQTGESPSNEDLLAEVRLRGGGRDLTIEAVKSAKKHVRTKFNLKLKRHEQQQERNWTPGTSPTG